MDTADDDDDEGSQETIFSEKRQPTPTNSGKFVLIECAFKSRLETYTAVGIPPGDLKTIFNLFINTVKNLLAKALKAFHFAKFNIFVECCFKNSKK